MFRASGCRLWVVNSVIGRAIFILRVEGIVVDSATWLGLFTMVAE